MSYLDTLTPEAAFQRYEELRPRLPQAAFPAHSLSVPGLRTVAEEVDAFVLDSFGVLNVGETAIPGAPDCLADLRAMGKRLIVLTNAASGPRSEALAKYRKLGFDFAADEVVSSRDVAARRLDALAPGGVWGAVATSSDDFADIPARVVRWTADDAPEVDGFLLLSSAEFDAATFAALARALETRPSPVAVANPDLVAPRETGLSKEPGLYAHALVDRLGLAPSFFGKPYGDAYTDVMERLPGVAPARVAMVGDTLHTDILGGRAAGMKTVLVTDHGLFAGLDASAFVARSGIVPDYVCVSI